MYTTRLAYRYATYHWGKTLILIVALACAIFVPLALNVVVAQGEAQLMRRAESTPLIVGAPGSRTDLVLHALHFATRPVNALHWSDVEELRAWKMGEIIPIDMAYTAQGYPVVGTTLEYFDFRGLQPASGTLPLMLGDCVVGAQVAQALELTPGDALMTDPENVFNIAGAYPLKMHVSGVLAPSATDDDRAVFVDVKTAWVIAGLGHGHEDLSKTTNDDLVLKRKPGEVVANAALPQYTEITPENIGSFHFHGDPGAFPVTAILVAPESPKSGTLLEGRVAETATRWQAVVPRAVIADLMGTVLKVKRLFDANVGLVALAMVLLLGLVVLLSIRMRGDEMAMMMKLGCSRGAMVWLQTVELAGIVFAALILAALATAGVIHAAAALVPWLMS